MDQEPVEPLIGPADDTPIADTKPPTVRVKLSGQEFDLTPDLSAALEAREQEFQRRMSEQSAELGRLRQQAPPPVTTRPTVDYDSLLFESPTRALTQLRNEIKQEIFSEIGAAYRNDQDVRGFWATFYTENPELQDAHDIVEAVLNANMNSWADLPVSQARDKLATVVRDRVHKMAQRFGAKTEVDLPKGKASAISGGEPAQRKAPGPAPEPTSITSILRKRREARLAAATKAK